MFTQILNIVKQNSNGKTSRKGKDIIHLPLIFLPYVALIAITLVTISCGYVPDWKFTFDEDEEIMGMGAMILDVDPGFQINTVLPEIDMIPAQYDFHGEGPNGSVFDVTDEQLPVYQRGLEIGEWTITVNVKNADGIIIAQGVQTAFVHRGEVITLQIPIRPVSGHGTLDLSVFWNEADIASPSLQGQIILDNGTTIDLDFPTIDPGYTQCIQENIPTGYHTLILQLLDNGVHVAGAVEVLRVIDNQTTSAMFEFYDINQSDGDISIILTPQMDEPLDIELTGQEAEIFEGVSTTVTATVAADVGPVEYMWYINEEYRDTGETFIIENNLQLGVYRLDVTAFTSDHRRAGSVTHTFSVIESQSATLMWDPNEELDLAGYRVYYGDESGVYPYVIDVGNTETYTVTGLREGESYYFAATAYNTVGLESTYSDEVVYTVPL